MPKTYTRLSRFNVRLSLEQYKVLLERKHVARLNGERVSYVDLVKAWGIQQYYMATAVNRGIKQYDYILWKEAELKAKEQAA